MKKCSVEDLSELHLFQTINKLTYEKLSSIGIVRSLKKGEHLFRDKDKLNYIYIIKSGKVSLYKLTESAQKKVVFIFGETFKLFFINFVFIGFISICVENIC